MKEFENDARLLNAAVREAGELVIASQKRGVKTWRKPDGTVVSDADLAANDFLERRLRQARPDYGWLSEESADNPDRRTAERVWMVDPIDGTHAFLAGGPDWCLAVALIEQGQPVLGALYCPPRNEFFTACRGAGARLNGAALQAQRPQRIEGARVIASKSLFKPQHWHEPLPPIEPIWVNSLAYRLAYVAAGRADAAFAFSPKWEWDIAAGALIAEEAGCTVTTADGDALTFNNETPRIDGFLAAAPVLHTLLLKRRKLQDRAAKIHATG